MISIYIYISGWWFGTWILWLSIYWECHHPNWLSYFSRWLKPPTRLVKSIYDFPHAKTMWNLDFSGWSTGMVRVCRLFRVVRLGKLSRFASFLRDRFESEVRSRWHGHGHGKTRKSGHELKGKTMFGHHITDKICEHIWFDLICVLKNSCDDRATLFFERDGEMLMF